MRVIPGLNRSQTTRWVTRGLLIAGVLAMGLVASAKRAPVPGWFQHVENGISHAQTPIDSHHICGMAMNSVLGHCSVTIALTKTDTGIIEYRLASGETIYGTVLLKQTANPEVSQINVHFTNGTGRFENRISGTGGVLVQYSAATLGVRPYTVRLQGIFNRLNSGDQN